MKLSERAEATETRARRAAEQKKAARRKAEAEANKSKSPGKKGKKGGKRASDGVRNPYMFNQLEKRIIKLEGKLSTLQGSCANADVYSNVDKLRETQFQIAEIERELEAANDEWANWE